MRHPRQLGSPRAARRPQIEVRPRPGSGPGRDRRLLGKRLVGDDLDAVLGTIDAERAPARRRGDDVRAEAGDEAGRAGLLRRLPQLGQQHHVDLPGEEVENRQGSGDALRAFERHRVPSAGADARKTVVEPVEESGHLGVRESVAAVGQDPVADPVGGRQPAEQGRTIGSLR